MVVVIISAANLFLVGIDTGVIILGTLIIWLLAMRTASNNKSIIKFLGEKRLLNQYANWRRKQ